MTLNQIKNTIVYRNVPFFVQAMVFLNAIHIVKLANFPNFKAKTNARSKGDIWENRAAIPILANDTVCK